MVSYYRNLRYITCFEQHNFLLTYVIFLLDAENECLNYQCIGEWTDVVERDGRHRYRNWFITGAGPGGSNVRIQYPKFWIHYFGHPVFYLISNTGKLKPYLKFIENC